MNLLILGRGKTGSLVAQVARERGHEIALLCAADNPGASALTADKLSKVDTVIDFTIPQAVLANIEACVAARKNMVVGTTGWYSELETVWKMVEKSGTGFLYAANFSIGINLLFEAAADGGGHITTSVSGTHLRTPPCAEKGRPLGNRGNPAEDRS